jgi:hypothetical protein
LCCTVVLPCVVLCCTVVLCCVVLCCAVQTLTVPTFPVSCMNAMHYKMYQQPTKCAVI